MTEKLYARDKKSKLNKNVSNNLYSMFVISMSVENG